MVTILDGGLATTLQDAGYDVEGHPLWSAHLLKTEPQAIVDAHSKFIEAGAEIVTTASYQVIVFLTDVDVLFLVLLYSLPETVFHAIVCHEIGLFCRD